jgi:DNA invertase Pin-like site-specific DNA recombinase
MDILQTIKVFNDKLIPIHFVSQGLITIVEGKENSIAKLIIGILGVVSEMELNQIRERQKQGVKLAKLKGSYKGRKTGSGESVVKFLSKPANELALKLLSKGYRIGEVATLAQIHPNTVAKVKRLGLPTQTKETA